MNSKNAQKSHSNQSTRSFDKINHAYISQFTCNNCYNIQLGLKGMKFLKFFQFRFRISDLNNRISYLKFGVLYFKTAGDVSSICVGSLSILASIRKTRIRGPSLSPGPTQIVSLLLLFSRFISDRHCREDVRPFSSVGGTEWSIGTFYAGRHSRFDAEGSNQLFGRPKMVCLERKARQKRIVIIHHAGKTKQNVVIKFSYFSAKSVEFTEGMAYCYSFSGGRRWWISVRVVWRGKTRPVERLS